MGKASEKTKDGTTKGGDKTKVNEIDQGQMRIDYKNDGFNEIVDEIGWARDKIKGKIGH